MKKQITETEQLIVAKMVEGYMDKFKELSPLMALSPTKGAHLFNLGIVSFVFTACATLDQCYENIKKSDPDKFVALNMHGKTFDNHLDFFVYLLKNNTHVERKL